MQRTTVRLPDDLLEEAKNLARRTSRTLTQLLEDSLRAELARTLAPAPNRVAERSAQYNARATRADTQEAEHAYPSGEQTPSPQHVHERLRAQVADIQAFLRTVPDRDRRTPDEILGYDANGLPG